MSTPLEHPVTVPERNELAARNQVIETIAQWRAIAPDPGNLDALVLGTPYIGDNPRRAILYPPPCAPLCEHYQWPVSRPHAINPALVQEGANVAITRPIAVGPDLLAQVYLADIESMGPVAVKVYQSTQMPELDPHDDKSSWSNSLHAYRNEFWAYERLRPVQGIVVPHVYGFFRVVLAHGEPAVVMIMEYIESDAQFVATLGTALEDDDKTVQSVGFGLMAVAHALNNCGVNHSDVAAKNMMWPQDQFYVSNIAGTRPRTGPLPVVIDFGQWSYDGDWNKACYVRHLARTLCNIMHADFELSHARYNDFAGELIKESEVQKMFFVEMERLSWFLRSVLCKHEDCQ